MVSVECEDTEEDKYNPLVGPISFKTLIDAI